MMLGQLQNIGQLFADLVLVRTQDPCCDSIDDVSETFSVCKVFDIQRPGKHRDNVL